MEIDSPPFPVTGDRQESVHPSLEQGQRNTAQPIVAGVSNTEDKTDNPRPYGYVASLGVNRQQTSMYYPGNGSSGCLCKSPSPTYFLSKPVFCSRESGEHLSSPVALTADCQQLDCRVRRIKCDRNRPECMNCVRANSPCGGYSDDLNLRAKRKPVGPSVSSGAKTPADGPAFAEERQNDIPLDKAVGKTHEPARSESIKGSYPTRGFGLDNSVSGSSEDDSQDIGTPTASAYLGSFLREGLNSKPGTRVGQKAPEMIIATYLPSPYDSPLSSPQTAAIFWHFVNVVAPMISLYESNGMYNGRFNLVKPIPVSVPYAAPEVSVWTGEWLLITAN